MAKCNVYSKRRTDYNMERKYYKQMNKLELSYLKEELNKINYLETSFHADDKLRELELNTYYINQLIHNFNEENIVEYNTGNGLERRVVIQDHTPIKCTNGREVYASYSIDIDKGFIITAWVNLIGDTHKTVDMRIYNENLKII